MSSIKKFFVVAVYAAALFAILGTAVFLYFSSRLPTVEQIASRQISQSTKIFDRSGKFLLYEVSAGEKRTVVPLPELPKYLKDLTISIEDRRFYESPSFDPRAIARALWINTRSSGNPLEGQGASTITQQLARNAFLTSERTLTRKIKELILSLRIARVYSKDQILELYLNEIPYGPTLYGVEAASEAYFGKSARDIDLAEAAVLAALPKAPSYYSPWGNHTKELFGRERLILETALKLGKITNDEFKVAVKEKVSFRPREEKLKAPHFVLEVRDYLTEKYGENLVSSGGLRVITTLDSDLQELAEKAVKSGAEENDRLYTGRNAALVAEDPKTGEILAMVGSRDYFATSSLPEGCTPGANCQFEPNFNVATQGLRQPGSSLKPFVYLTAFEKGYTPETIIFDTPTEFAAQNPDCPPTPDFKETKPNKECFHPENFRETFSGPVSMRTALGQSINVPAVKVLYLAGLTDSVKNANKFGLKTLTSPNLYGLSLVLGGGAVRLVDLVSAYSALAADGVKHEQTMVLEVRDAEGNILESHKPEEEQVADPEPVRMVNNILSDVGTRSGLMRNSTYLTTFPEYDVALKTGTSNDYRDAWSIGYTPSLVVGVWAGNNDNSPMQRHGGSILAAVPIWSNFFGHALAAKNIPKETFPRPEPTNPQKPILAGDYAAEKQIHSILYYVDRKNPLGPQPADPSQDPQFADWEAGVLSWAASNIPDFSAYNQPFDHANTDVSGKTPPKIEIDAPASGSFVGKQFEISANISSSGTIAAVNIYWNGAQLQGFSVNVRNSYILHWKLEPPAVEPQNLLEVEAVNDSGSSSRAGVIVYK